MSPPSDTDDTQPNHDADLPLGEGYVTFESETSQAFRQLVREMLDGSDFITTEWQGEQLVIKEISSEFPPNDQPQL